MNFAAWTFAWAHLAQRRLFAPSKKLTSTLAAAKEIMMNNYQIGQKIRMTDKISGRVVEGTIVDVKEDRVRATPFGKEDNGIGFGFHFRALDRVCVVEVI